jgi:hypothetical protein
MAVKWDVEQGSPEWLQRRLGIPTTSQFHRIVTKGGALSEQRHDYRNELLAERVLKQDLGRVKPTEWMRRGTNLEGEALTHFLRRQRDLYGRRMTLEPGGFITSDDGRVGSSPDRIIKTDNPNLASEAVEIKCPAPWTHVGYLLDGPGDAYVMQVQGQMLVGQFDLVHFYSYHPDFPPYHAISERNNRIIDLLRTRLETFLAEVDAAEATLRKLMGHQL